MAFDTLSSFMLAGGGEELGVGSDFALAFEDALILQLLEPESSGKKRKTRNEAQYRVVVAPGE